MLTYIELEKAQEILSKNVKALKELENVNLYDALNRVLGEDIYSAIDQPPFNRSPLDGYAFNFKDSNGASGENPAILKVIDKTYAGHVPQKRVFNKNCTRIMTGAPIPEGATAVVKQEDVEVKGDYIKIYSEFKQWQNISFRGEDVRKGQLILKKGTVLKHGEIGILASIGIENVKVYRLPKVSIFSTGDELLDIGEDLVYGKIYNSNLYCISSRIKECFAIPYSLGSVKDDEVIMMEKFKEAIKDVDLIITTGGVSVGEKDIVKNTIEKMGGKVLFWKIKIKPGSAIVCSILNEKLIISLSGNPGAAITAFELIVRPVLAKISNRKDLNLRKIKGILRDEFNKDSKVRRFIRGNIDCRVDGNLVSITQKSTGNGILSSILNSNCLIDVKQGTDGLKKGQIIEAFLL